MSINIVRLEHLTGRISEKATTGNLADVAISFFQEDVVNEFEAHRYYRPTTVSTS